MIRLGIILILAAGIGLTVHSFYLPYYTNLAAKERLEEDTNDKILSYSNSSEAEKAENNYYQAIEKLKTNKTTYFDAGTGIIVASTIVLAFLLLFRIRRISDFNSIRSFNKTKAYLISIPLWLLMLPGTYWYYSFRAERGDYPMFADSIAIPIVGGFLAIFIGFLLFLPFLIVSTSISELPTFIFIRARKYNAISILREIFWGFLLIVDLVCFLRLIVDGDHVSIIVSLYFIYLLLTLRAGITNRYNGSLYSIENDVLANK